MTIFQLLHLVDLTSLVASHLQVLDPIPEPILTLPSLSSHICVGEFVEIIGDLEGVFVVTDVGERVGSSVLDCSVGGEEETVGCAVGPAHAVHVL